MKKLSAYLCSISLIVALLLGMIRIIAFNEAFYNYEYTSLNTAESINMSNEDLMIATHTLLDYLNQKVDSLDLKLEINGEIKEVYNTREKDHMVDVMILYQNAMKVMYVSIFVAFISFINICLNKDFKTFKQSYLNILKGLGMILIFLIIFAVLDFESFWTTFHKIFFRNDLWLLNPRTDILINMVPQKFFSDLVFLISTCYIVSLLLVYVILNILERKYKNDTCCLI